MGKKRSTSKKNKSVRSELLGNEAEHRRSVEETYTKPIHPGQDLKEFRDFLSIFYRHIYRREEELKRLVRQNAVIRQHYERLVPRQISHEDFFQRYLYRCDKQRVFNWEKRHSQNEQDKSSSRISSSSLLDDAAEVQVREALRTSEWARKDGSDADDTEEVQTSEESGNVTEQRSVEMQAKEKVASSENKKSESPVMEPATIIDQDDALKEASKLPGLLSLDSTPAVSDDGSSNSGGDLPPVLSSSGKGLLLGGLVMVLFLFVYGARNRVEAFVCDAIRTDPSTDYFLPWWSPENWHSGVHSVLCTRQSSTIVLVTDTQDTEQNKPRPWSAFTNKVRWHRRRTQNFHTSNGVVTKELVEDDENLHKDAAPRWSLQKWRSDQQKEIAQSQQDASAVSPWSALADKVRGRGWKSKSWGTTDDGDVICEEQKISVTTEGPSRSTTSSRTELVTSRKQAYTKTVVTEVKKTTIYSPVK